MQERLYGWKKRKTPPWEARYFETLQCKQCLNFDFNSALETLGWRLVYSTEGEPLYGYCPECNALRDHFLSRKERYGYVPFQERARKDYPVIMTQDDTWLTVLRMAIPRGGIRF